MLAHLVVAALSHRTKSGKPVVLVNKHSSLIHRSDWQGVPVRKSARVYRLQVFFAGIQRKLSGFNSTHDRLIHPDDDADICRVPRSSSTTQIMHIQFFIR